MTEPAGPLEAGQRGSLSIADSVIDKLASHAAQSVAGVVSSGSALDKVVGRRLPKASSQVSGRQARVAMEIAVQWPLPLAEVAADVRSTVARAVSTLSGLDVAAVDVSVARIERVSAGTTRRVQ